MSDEIRITDAELDEWLRHPTTKIHITNISVLVDRALKGVLGAARTSSDPDVRGASAKYHTYLQMLKILQEKHGKHDDSE